MAAVIFDSIIKTNPLGRWYIELRDPQEQQTETCLDIEEYALKIEDMGAIYGGDVEVAWSAEENVTQAQIDEVRQAMIAYDKSQKDDIL